MVLLVLHKGVLVHYEGREYLNLQGNDPRFYRIIRYGGLLTVRYGRCGELGETLHERVSEAAAIRKFNGRVATKQQSYSCIREDSEDLQLPADLYLCDAYIETTFLRRWHDESPIASPQELEAIGTHWQILHHVIKNTTVTTYERFILDDVSCTPHAIDEVRGLLLAPITDSRYSNRFYGDSLGPVCPSHTPEVAARALALYYEGHPAPDLLFETALALARTS
jgi:predicted DNA-binding WGR domain protein